MLTNGKRQTKSGKTKQENEMQESRVHGLAGVTSKKKEQSRPKQTLVQRTGRRHHAALRANLISLYNPMAGSRDSDDVYPGVSYEDAVRKYS